MCMYVCRSVAHRDVADDTWIELAEKLVVDAF